MNNKKPFSYSMLLLGMSLAIPFEVSASPEISYEIKNSRCPSSVINLCNTTEVYTALKEKLPGLTPPVDLNIRGISARTPYRLEANSKIGSYGETRKSKDGSSRFHAGTDLIADIGEPVKAVMDGRIIATANQIGSSGFGLGNYIWLESEVNVPPAKSCKVIFSYAHLQERSPWIKGNTEVKAGDIIGKVGRSGYDKNELIPTHLHIELWINKYNYKKRYKHTRDIIPAYNNF